jgi:hypothetical protein
MMSALQGSGTLLELVNLEKGGGFLGVRRTRGVVGQTPSKGVHRRYCQAVAAVPWESMRSEDLWAVVLTYHNVPRDGLQVRDDKKAFMRRLDRILGEGIPEAWSNPLPHGATHSLRGSSGLLRGRP